MKHFFKTGEFAALCGVKKDTLLHYDQIGILKPAKQEENGYRSYSVKQLYTFDLISALKRLGMPLSEIKTYLDGRSPAAFLTLLHQQQAILEEEQRRLAQVNLLLQETIAATEHAQRITPGSICLETLPEEHYVAIKAPDYSHYDERQYLLRSRSLLRWAREHGSLSFPPGDIITKESLAQGSFVEDYFYCRVSPDAEGEAVSIRPGGTYAVLYHKGSYESLEKAYETLVRWVLAQGYAISGNLYEEDLLHYLSTSDPNDYVMKISVQVSQKSQ